MQISIKIRAMCFALIAIPLITVGCQQKDGNIKKDPSKILVGEDLHIYNVITFTDYDILIVKRNKDLLSTGDDVYLLAFSKDKSILDYANHKTCTNFHPAYFIYEDAFLIIICETLFVFDKSNMRFRSKLIHFRGVLYAKDNIIYAEAPAGVGVKVDFMTLEKIEEYHFKPYTISDPEMFTSIDDIYLDPASLVEKEQIIKEYKELLDIDFIGNE